MQAGIHATVLTGGQAGLITNENHGNAQIIAMKPNRILELLEQDQGCHCYRVSRNNEQ